MLFEAKYYDNLDPGYREALIKLETEYFEKRQPGNCETFFSLCNRDNGNKASDLIEFVERYMTSKQFWKMVSNNVPGVLGVLARKFPFLSFRFLFFNSSRFKPRKNYQDNLTTYLPWKLLFPFNDLEQRMEDHERSSNSFVAPMVRQRYKAMKELYSKIVAAENDLDEWIASLMEAKNHQFVCDNVEKKLAGDLNNKILWKKYINYLCKYDYKRLLETYSKCIRFFTDDLDLMEEYRHAAIKYGDYIPVPWKNPCSFEVYDAEFWNRKSEEQKSQESSLNYFMQPVPEPLTIHYDGRNVAKPQFPFLPPTIQYILDNASGDVLQKLFKTCKWFRVAKPVNVCCRFFDLNKETNHPVTIRQDSIWSSNNQLLNTNLDKIFISTSLYFENPSSTALSILKPRIYSCTAKFVEIVNQNLSMEELQFFIASAIDLKLINVHNSSGTAFDLETILQVTPNIREFKISNIAVTAKTSKKLCLLKFQKKIERLSVSYIKNTKFDPVGFGDFIKKNCKSNAIVEIQFQLGIGGKEYVKEYREIIENAMKESWTEDLKCCLFIKNS